jgi:hypothetical protein
MDSFLIIAEVGHMFEYFFRGKSFVLIMTKMGWATFWAIYSQTHLVTLIVSEKKLPPTPYLLKPKP